MNPADIIRLGIIGNPVKQSQSPRLFREIFAERPDILSRYSYDLIEESDFRKAFERFDRDYYAVNVTAPFKANAFRAADKASPLCTQAGAANILYHKDGRVIADNADCLAVKQILEGLPCDIFSSRVLVIGCGGAGRAAITAAMAAGAKVTVINRTLTTAENFAESLHQYYDSEIGIHRMETLPEEVRKADIIVYALPTAIPELKECDFTGHTVLEAKYYDTSIKPAPVMTYIPGTEWLRLQALATYHILGIATSVEY